MNEQPIKIAILDSVPKFHWRDDNGITDGQKFVDLLAPENANAKFDIFYVSEYEFPDIIESYDGYLLTGSPVSVHDNYDWIKMLSEFVGPVSYTHLTLPTICSV